MARLINNLIKKKNEEWAVEHSISQKNELVDVVLNKTVAG